MDDVVLFASRADRSAQGNLEAFIEAMRRKPNPFGDIEFDEDVWDITATTRGSGLGIKRISFSTLETANASEPELLPALFRQFAKAYLISRQELAPTQNQQQRLSALRALEFVQRKFSLQLSAVRGDHLNHAASLIAQRFSAEGAYRIGRQLELLVQFVSEAKLLAAPLQWTNAIPRPRGTVRVGAAHEEQRVKKLPSGEALQAITLAFRQAEHPSDKLVAALAALLCSAPVRIGEVLRMRADCEVEDRTAKGAKAYGLRWWTEKGVDPEVRWVLPQMVPTVRVALATIREVTAEARKIAAWYERRPNEIYLPPKYEDLRREAFIDLEEAGLLLGVAADDWAARHRLPMARLGDRTGFDFGQFERAVLADLPSEFPLMERATRLKAAEALFVVSFNEFRTDRRTSLCMFEPVTQARVANALGARSAHGVPSVFSRLGLVSADGSPIKVKTHAFRHYLNTLAQRGGLDPLDIAKWSGRKSVAQNAAYDHVSADEMLEDLDAATGGELQPVKVQPPATREEFAGLATGAAHVTEYGFCLHDFAMLPCLLHRDCLNCDEHVCVKGDLAKEARMAAHLEQARLLLAYASEGDQAGYEGADRWRDHQQRTIERVENIWTILQDPDVPNGTVIRPVSGELPENGRHSWLAQSALGKLA